MNGRGNPGKTSSYAMLRLKILLRHEKRSNRSIPGVSRRPHASFTASELANDLQDGSKRSPGENDPGLGCFYQSPVSLSQGSDLGERLLRAQK